jgi:hypothetical protein
LIQSSNVFSPSIKQRSKDSIADNFKVGANPFHIQNKFINHQSINQSINQSIYLFVLFLSIFLSQILIKMEKAFLDFLHLNNQVSPNNC